MLNKTFIHFFLAVTIFHLAACSFPPALQSPVSPKQPTLLTDHQTHAFLKDWNALHYRTDIKGANFTFVNKHPYAKKIHKIVSGYSIDALAKRSKGIGLPVVVLTEKHKTKQITQNAYQLTLHPGNLVITKSPIGHFEITLLDTRVTPRFYGRPLKTQENIVIDHITNDPDNRAMDLFGLLFPEKFTHKQGIYLSRPYDKNKIPIIMIHGLFSSPEAFSTMAEKIESHPDLFQKYQIWYYYYPTGTPWLVTAHHFRSSFRALIKKLDPTGTHKNLRETTIIAHSMGGLITRISLSPPDKHLSKAYLGELNPKTFLTKKQLEKITPYFHYSPLTEPKQVIFLAVPHKGSKMASGFIGWTVRKVISIPQIIIQQTFEILLPHQKEQLSEHALRLFSTGETSIDQLKPNDPSLKALNSMKLPGHIHAYSVVGDMGLPVLRLYSDGVVPYRSSHLGNQASETIIPANHDITDNKKSIERVIQILLQ